MKKDFQHPDFDKLARLNTDAQTNSGRTVKRNFSDNERPMPLRRQLTQSIKFPVAALGAILSAVAIEVQKATQAPMALCAQSTLAVASLAAQGHRDVEIDGRRCPTSEFFAAIAESGERKTGIDRILMRSARKHEEELQREYEIELQLGEHDLAAYETARSGILKNKGKLSKEDILSELQNLGDRPQKPLSPVVCMEDPTPEGVIKLLENGQPSVGVFTDEGGRFIGGVGMTPENQLKTAATFSKFWDGSSITRTRVSDESMRSTIMYGKRMAMSLMIQPVVARQMLGNGTLLGQGLLSRILSCWPESTIGTREYQEINLSKNAMVQAYEERLLELFRAEKRMREGKKNELDPIPLGLSKQAKKLWVPFYNDVEKKLKDGSKYAQIRGFGAKIPEHALRLAGILNVVDNLDAGFVTQRSVEGGIELANFYLDETLRISHESTEDTDLLLAEELLSWIQLRGDSPFYLSQVYQFGPNQIRNAKDAARTIAVLENHGWVESRGAMKLDGSMRKETWALRSFGDEQ